MAQQQYNYYPTQAASQHMANQEWSANSGNVYTYNGNVYHVYPPAQMQVPAAPYPAQHNGPEGHFGAPAPFPQGGLPVSMAPGFAHQGPGFGKPRPGGSGVQSVMKHVCHCMAELATERERQILHVLCHHLVAHSNSELDCSKVGIKVVRTCVDLFASDEVAAKKAFWRRAQKTASQRECRAAEKQQRSQPQGRDSTLQYAAAPTYHQQTIGDNAGHFQADPNAPLNGMPLGHNVGIPIQTQMPQGETPFSAQEIAQAARAMQPHFFQ
jgi:hypothetical protein